MTRSRMPGSRSRVAFLVLRYLFPGPVVKLVFRPHSRGGALPAAAGPLIIAANHLSFLDPVFIQLTTRRHIIFLGKEEYFTRAGIAGLMWRSLFQMTGLVIPVDRSGGPPAEAAMEAAKAILAAGGIIGIFPEGTRSPDGRLYRGHTGVARLALDTGAQVVPVALLNSRRILLRGRLTPAIMRATMVIGEPVQYGQSGSPAAATKPPTPPVTPGDEMNYRAVTDTIMSSIRNLSGQEYVDTYAISPAGIAYGDTTGARDTRPRATETLAAARRATSAYAAALVPVMRSGILNPGSPVRIARQITALRRWGPGPAGLMRAAASRSPRRIGLIDPGGELTYRSMVVRADRLACLLGDRAQVKEGDRVGILCRNHRGAVEALTAALTVGADAVLLNTHLSRPQLARITAEQHIQAVIHDAPSEQLATAMADPPVLLRVPAEASASPPGGSARARPRPKRGRVIILTSGTTGTPKGAIRPRVSGAVTLASMLARIPVRAGDRMFIAVPLFSTLGHAAFEAALGLRATVITQPRFEPAEAARLVSTARADILVVAPVMLEMLLDSGVPVTGLRVVLSGGSALRRGLATRFMDAYGDVLYNIYGSTEASCVSIATPPDLRRAPDTAGRPLRGTIVAIVDAAGHPVPPGAVGRICVRNTTLFDGYLSGAMAAMQDRLLVTGDLGHLTPDGLLFVDAREDDMIISGGENAFPGPVEEIIGLLPQVREAAVVGVPDDRFGQAFAAFIVLREGQTLDAERVRLHVGAHLARSSVPRDVTFIAEMSRNAAGKIATRQLATGGET